MSIISNIDIEKLIFNFVLKEPKYMLSLYNGFFKSPDINTLYRQNVGFFKKYQEIPSLEQVIALNKSAETETENKEIPHVDEESIRAIYNVDLDNYDFDWLRHKTEVSIKWDTFYKNLTKVLEYIKLAKIDDDNKEDIILKSLDTLNKSKTISFDRDLGDDFFDASTYTQEEERKVPSSWEFFNSATQGGFDPKTLNVYMGQSNIGKSIFLCNDAANLVRKGLNVLYITCEMSKAKVKRRIMANLADCKLSTYDEKVKTPEGAKRLIQYIKQKHIKENSLNSFGNFYIKQYPTSHCTAIDVESYIKEFEETKQIKIDVVVIDYINILSNYRNPNTENTYMKIKQICEDLRGVAVKKDVVIISATQINRKAYDEADINLSDVSESMALVDTCDTIFAIIQTIEMRQENQFDVKIVKVREGAGKNERFHLTIDYDKMKLTEGIEEQTFDF